MLTYHQTAVNGCSITLPYLAHKPTAAEKIFGLSSGAICVLQTAIIAPALKKVVLYEPPNPAAWSDRYESALSRGYLGKAMFTAIKGTDDPSLFTAMPGFIMGPLLNPGINAEAKKATGDDVPLKSLVPTMHYDLMLVGESPGLIDQCQEVKADGWDRESTLPYTRAGYIKHCFAAGKAYNISRVRTYCRR